MEPTTPLPPKQNAFFDRLRGHRLTTTFHPARHPFDRGPRRLRAYPQCQRQRATGRFLRRPGRSKIPDPVALSNGFSQIARQVGPAVVNINTEELAKPVTGKRGRRGRAIPLPNPHGNGNGSDDGGDGSEESAPQTPGDMQDFFNRFFGGQGGQGGSDDGSDGPDGGSRRALGSGFIVDSRGYIITNNPRRRQGPTKSTSSCQLTLMVVPATRVVSRMLSASIKTPTLP